MPDESVARRARMLGLQADAEDPPTKEEKIARSLETPGEMRDRRVRQGGLGDLPSDVSTHYTFAVSSIIAEARLGAWSEPVLFKFEHGADGRLEMWMRTVQRSDDGT